MSFHGTHQITSRRGGGPTRRIVSFVAVLTSIATLSLGCGHSEDTAESSTTAKDSEATSSTAPDDEPGVFGELGQICGPSDGESKPSDVRGVTDTELQIGVLNDAGNELSPGLGAAYPKVAKAFADWCNDAGGINGRKIVINDRDAKLFDSAAVVIDACQSDFMLVGGGAALDAPTIEPRLECGLGAIPSLNPSYEAQVADLQAVVGRTSTKESNWGLFRLLEPEYKDAFQKIGILTVDTPDVRVAYENFQKVLDGQGLDVTTFQAVAVSLDNVRTYVQPLVDTTETLVLALPVVEIFQAMNDVGYEPEVVADAGSVFYSLEAVKNLNTAPLKAPIYSAATTFPLDRTKDNSTAAKFVELETAAFGDADPADVTPWITWLLFAKSASACDELTVECVIDNATKDKAYTAGGLMAPIDLSDPTVVNHCLAISKVSADGIVYDEKATQPTDSLFNCDPANVVPVP